MNYVVKNREKMDRKDIRRKFKGWEATPFYAGSLELHYRDIPRKVIAEEYMEEQNGGLYDYKIHCFHGKPAFIQCIGDRDLKQHKGFQANYDLKWNRLDWTFEDYPSFSYEVPRPEHLDQMIEYARKLSEGFLYVRVDLYEIRDDVYFGEMTFAPACGYYPYHGTWTREKDLELGSLLKLPINEP